MWRRDTPVTKAIVAGAARFLSLDQESVRTALADDDRRGAQRTAGYDVAHAAAVTVVGIALAVPYLLFALVGGYLHWSDRVFGIVSAVYFAPVLPPLLYYGVRVALGVSPRFDPMEAVDTETGDGRWGAWGKVALAAIAVVTVTFQLVAHR